MEYIISFLTSDEVTKLSSITGDDEKELQRNRILNGYINLSDSEKQLIRERTILPRPLYARCFAVDDCLSRIEKCVFWKENIKTKLRSFLRYTNILQKDIHDHWSTYFTCIFDTYAIRTLFSKYVCSLLPFSTCGFQLLKSGIIIQNSNNVPVGYIDNDTIICSSIAKAFIDIVTNDHKMKSIYLHEEKRTRVNGHSGRPTDRPKPS